MTLAKFMEEGGQIEIVNANAPSDADTTKSLLVMGRLAEAVKTGDADAGLESIAVADRSSGNQASSL